MSSDAIDVDERLAALEAHALRFKTPVTEQIGKRFVRCEVVRNPAGEVGGVNWTLDGWPQAGRAVVANAINCGGSASTYIAPSQYHRR